MATVNLGLFFSKQLQTVNQPAQTPRPFAIGTIVLQFRIESVKIILSSLLMLPPL